MQIRVGKYHIRKGTPGSANSCAVALALQNQIRIKNTSVTVDGSTAEITSENGNTASYNLPLKVQKFMERFDEDRTKARPVTFNIPQRVIRALKSGN